MVGPIEPVVDRIAWLFQSTMDAGDTSPSALSHFVAQVELEAKIGDRFRCSLYLAIFCRVNDELRVWRVGSNGVFVGPPSGMHFMGTDQRHMAMRQRGEWPEPRVRFAETDILENLISPCMVGLPSTYESFEVRLQRDDIVIAFNQSSLPFHPVPLRNPIAVEDLCRADAGHRHGFVGRALLFTRNVDLVDGLAPGITARRIDVA